MFVAVELGVAAVAAYTIAEAFSYDVAVAPVHLGLVLGGTLRRTLAVGSVTRGLAGVSRAAAGMFVTFSLGVSASFLLMLYAANVGSNLAWHAKIGWALLTRADAHLAALAAAIQMPH